MSDTLNCDKCKIETNILYNVNNEKLCYNCYDIECDDCHNEFDVLYKFNDKHLCYDCYKYNIHKQFGVIQ